MVVSRHSRGEKTTAAPAIVPLVGLSRLFVINEVREAEGRIDPPALHDRMAMPRHVHQLRRIQQVSCARGRIGCMATSWLLGEYLSTGTR